MGTQKTTHINICVRWGALSIKLFQKVEVFHTIRHSWTNNYRKKFVHSFVCTILLFHTFAVEPYLTLGNAEHSEKISYWACRPSKTQPESSQASTWPEQLLAEVDSECFAIFWKRKNSQRLRLEPELHLAHKCFTQRPKIRFAPSVKIKFFLNIPMMQKRSWQ